jgi:hypothetical protein
MTEDRENTDAQDVEAHVIKGHDAAVAQNAEAHGFKISHGAEETQDVEAHTLKSHRHEDAPPAKPGTEGRDDVEGHVARSGR